MTSHPADMKTANRSGDEEFDEITEEEVERSMSEACDTSHGDTMCLIECNNSELIERLNLSYDLVLTSTHSMGDEFISQRLESDTSYSVCVLVDKQDTPLAWKLSSSLKVRFCGMGGLFKQSLEWGVSSVKLSSQCSSFANL